MKNPKNDKDSASYITRPEIGTYETEMGASGPEFALTPVPRSHYLHNWRFIIW